jgi:RNA polymerase primary sigma factor
MQRDDRRDLFRVYLDQIGRHPLLTKEDEIELSQAYQAGLQAQRKLAECSPDDAARPKLQAVADHGQWARRKMIQPNLRQVVSIAREQPAPTSHGDGGHHRLAGFHGSA